MENWYVEPECFKNCENNRLESDKVICSQNKGHYRSQKHILLVGRNLILQKKNKGGGNVYDIYGGKGRVILLQINFEIVC